MAKHFKVIEVYFFKKLKYFDIFKKNIAWILQQVCKFPKDFGLHFKNTKFFYLF
jgi:hypothetical protein